MAKLTFKPRATSNKSGTIYLFFNYGTNNRFRYSTGLRVQNINNWDKTRMRIKNVTEELDRQFINTRLTDLQQFIESEYLRLAFDSEKDINDNALRDLCDLFFGRLIEPETNKHLELLEFYEWFIEYYSTNPLLSNGKLLGSGTARTYKNSLNILKRFSTAMYKVDYESISETFYTDFLEWLRSQDYSSNYIGTQIKILKTMLSASSEKGYHTSIEHTKRYFKKPGESIDNIFLTTDELERFENIDLKEADTVKISKYLYLTPELLEKSRDLFLISANTGLRVSDFNRLQKENIFEKGGNLFLRIITKKNDKPLTIPLNSTVKRILNKYNGNPPRKVPDQHINYAVKEIGRLAKINKPVAKTVTQGGKKSLKHYKKFELITNHTGRRSFCTNAYLSGMPTVDIMAISGHSTEKVFYNYIKVNDLERAMKIADHQFFQ